MKKLEWTKPVLTDLGTAMTSGQIGTAAASCGNGSSFNSDCSTGTGAGPSGCAQGYSVFGTCHTGNDAR